MKNLIRVCGVINLLAAAFHIWLGTVLGGYSGMTPDMLVLMQMLNTAVVMAFLFLGLSMTFVTGEMIGTNIGRLVVAFGTAVYMLRSSQEIILTSNINWTILGVCAFIGFLHLVALLGLRSQCGTRCECADSAKSE